MRTGWFEDIEVGDKGSVWGGQVSSGKFALFSLFLNWQNTLFDVGRSMFDVNVFGNIHLIKASDLVLKVFRKALLVLIWTVWCQYAMNYYTKSNNENSDLVTYLFNESIFLTRSMSICAGLRDWGIRELANWGIRELANWGIK